MRLCHYCRRLDTLLQGGALLGAYEIKGLAEFTAKTIVSDEKQWKKFLHTAGH